MHVVRHRLAFDQIHAPLLAQLPQNLSNPTPQPPVQHLPPVLRNDDHVVLAFPSHVGQTLPIMQRASTSGTTPSDTLTA